MFASYERNAAFATTTGEFSVYAFWTTTPFDLDIDAALPPLGSCVHFGPDASMMPEVAAAGEAMDVGSSAAFDGSNAAITLSRYLGSNVLSGGGSAAFMASSPYFLRGGPDGPTFAVPMISPEDFTPLAPPPPPAETGVSVINRAEGLPLEWEAGTGPEPVIAIAEATEPGTVPAEIELCTFPDSGSAMFPSSALGRLPAGGGFLFVGRRSVAIADVHGVVQDGGLTYTRVDNFWYWQAAFQ